MRYFRCILFSCSLLFSGQALASVEVEVSGVEGDEYANVMALLQIARLDKDKSYADYRVRYLHRQAPADIRKALRPYGYYQVEVNAQLETVDGGWSAAYQIELNDPVQIAKNIWEIQGDAAEDKVFDNIVDNSNLKEKQRFIHSNYEQVKSRLLSLASQRGYHDARFIKHNVEIDIAENTADIEVVFDSGKRYQYGQVTFEQDILDDELLHRFVPFEPGEGYSTQELSQLQVALSDSGYFSQIQVSPDWESAEEHTVPISVSSEPNFRNQYQYGVGYGTDTGARISASLNRRWVNTQGHQLRGMTQLSEVESRVGANYIIPGQNPQSDYYQIRAEASDKNNEGQTNRLYRFGASSIVAMGKWQREYGLNWQRDDFEIGESSGTSQFLIPQASWNYLTADGRLNIDKGFRFDVTLKAANEALLSDADMASMELGFKAIVPVTDNIRFLARAEAGATYIDDFNQLPPSLRFFAGGDNSVRGYAYEQLGPEDDTGTVLGGRYLAVASAEIDYRFMENWRVALFTDIGNAMIEPNEKLKQSVGFGIRWISPIGSVRLDLAQAIDEPDKPWRLHFTLGPDL
ncbi:autotransporter assembly complex protein TamA [Idiomarina sp. M1R2S28]|uniref:Translocation and assembly module subunit TamA n=1 Tax=Idiomarina rhizosphaerae TaxID=2961572 RepID=A0A9X2FWP7_9GAMM|nr:autotransporter assembly complex family protein [Idiomarina rhizosphaerae]MCP1340624.1 autotransporter assembly complex protein TamA [Idiomarina rhizosphaerae]